MTTIRVITNPQGPPGSPGTAGLTTKGDLLVHSGSSATRLPVGTDGKVLVADSGEAEGVKWNTFVHALGGASHTQATLAEINALISDATLDDASDTRTPAAHALGGSAHSADTLANLNSRISDATLAAVAGQLGGTAASPDVRGIRETGGPTLLTLGAVADTYLLVRSGSTVVGAARDTLQSVTDRGNVNTNELGVGDGGAIGSGIALRAIANALIIKNAGNNHYAFSTTASGFFPYYSGRVLGSPGTPWHDFYTDGEFHHKGSAEKWGVFGATPVVRVAAYTPTNVTPDRSFDADTVTVAELADVVGTIIADWQSYGYFQ